MCSLACMRIILRIASLLPLRLTKIDVKFAFLQTGRAERKAYVHAPPEFGERGPHVAASHRRLRTHEL